MNSHKMYDYMVKTIIGCEDHATEEALEQGRHEYADCLVPAYLLPPGEWEPVYDDIRFDGITWGDGVPPELGKNGCLWVIDESRILWVVGAIPSGPMGIITNYWRFAPVPLNTN